MPTRPAPKGIGLQMWVRASGSPHPDRAGPRLSRDPREWYPSWGAAGGCGDEGRRPWSLHRAPGLAHARAPGPVRPECGAAGMGGSERASPTHTGLGAGVTLPRAFPGLPAGRRGLHPSPPPASARRWGWMERDGGAAERPKEGGVAAIGGTRASRPDAARWAGSRCHSAWHPWGARSSTCPGRFQLCFLCGCLGRRLVGAGPALPASGWRAGRSRNRIRTLMLLGKNKE